MGHVGLLVQMQARVNWMRQEDLTPRSLSPQRVRPPPQLDGRLDDPAWQGAVPATGFVRANSTELARGQTLARICHDDRTPYVSLECLERDPAKVRADETAHDGRVWSDDSVEVFLDADRDRATYHHFIVNSIGTRYEEIGHGPNWNGQWTAACSITDRGWTAEMAFPFAGLSVHPGVGDVWGLLLTRNSKTWGESSAVWQTGAHFHRPGLFTALWCCSTISNIEVSPSD